jgi:selenocysteine lyase/cysteine desulfurase
MVQNATEAINCLLKSLSWSANDVVVLPNTAYISVRKTVEEIRQHYSIKILDVSMLLIEIEFKTEDFSNAAMVQSKIEQTVNGCL